MKLSGRYWSLIQSRNLLPSMESRCSFPGSRKPDRRSCREPDMTTPVYSFTPRSYRIHFNIVFHLHVDLHVASSHHAFRLKCSMRFSTHSCYFPHQSDPLWQELPNMCWRVGRNIHLCTLFSNILHVSFLEFKRLDFHHRTMQQVILELPILGSIQTLLFTE